MKKKGRKIFGIGAGVLMIVVAFGPIVNAQFVKVDRPKEGFLYRGETTCCPLINSIEGNTTKASIYGLYENYVKSPDGEWINVTAKWLVYLPFTFGMKVPQVLGPSNEYKGFVTSMDTPGRLTVNGFMWCFGEVELW